MELQLLLMLRSHATPWLTWLMRTVTDLASGGPYVVALVVLYWGYSRRLGFLLWVAFLASAAVNVGAKAVFALPRPPQQQLPWLAPAGGLGFPSGHSQLAATLWALTVRGKPGWALPALAWAIVVGFSRLYLGVHYPHDVVGGWVIGGLIGLLMWRWAPALIDDRPASTAELLAWTLLPLLVLSASRSQTALALAVFSSTFLPAHRWLAGTHPWEPRAGRVGLWGRLALGAAGVALLAGILPRHGLPALWLFAAWGLWLAAGAPMLFLRLGWAGLSSDPAARHGSNPGAGSARR